MNAQISRPFAVLAALGQENLTAVNAHGYNPDIGTSGTPETIWENSSGVIAPLSAASVVAIVSSSANDTAAGTGARTLKVTGVTASWQEVSETVALNGTTPVNTTNQFLFLNEIKVLTVGSGGASAGNISATASGSTLCYLSAGRNRSLQAAYAVPAGKTAVITKVWGACAKATSAGAAVRLHLKTKEVADALFYTRHAFHVQATGANANHDFSVGLRAPEKTIIRLDCEESLIAATPVTGGFELVLL